jgi:hypothetical protein
MKTNEPGTPPALLLPACPRCGCVQTIVKMIEPSSWDEFRMPFMLVKMCSNCGGVLFATPA